MKSVDFFFSGYYGMGNYGDDLFAITALEAAAYYWSGGRSSLDVPAGYLEGHGFPRLIGTSPEFRQADQKLARLARIRDCFVGAWHADHFIVAGGSTFTSGRLNARSLTMRFPGRLFGTRFSAIGVSVGPFRTAEDRRRMGKYLAKFEYLALRDGKSVEEVKQIDSGIQAVRAADLAGVYATLHRKPIGPARGLQTIGFAPCRQRNGSDLRFCDAFVGAMDILARELGTRPRIRLFCLNVHPRVGDVQLCDYTQDRLTERGFVVDATNYANIGVAATWDEIAKTDFFVSGRLHGAMTVYLQGVPFVVHEYHAKCTDWLRDIGGAVDFGLPNVALKAEELFRRIITVQGLQPLDPEAYMARALLNFTSAPWVDPRFVQEGASESV